MIVKNPELGNQLGSASETVMQRVSVIDIALATFEQTREIKLVHAQQEQAKQVSAFETVMPIEQFHGKQTGNIAITSVGKQDMLTSAHDEIAAAFTNLGKE